MSDKKFHWALLLLVALSLLWVFCTFGEKAAQSDLPQPPQKKPVSHVECLNLRASEWWVIYSALKPERICVTMLGVGSTFPASCHQRSVRTQATGAWHEDLVCTFRVGPDHDPAPCEYQAGGCKKEGAR